MDRNNMEKLMRHMETVPAEEFYMGQWVNRESECGTPACLGGYAAALAVGKLTPLEELFGQTPEGHIEKSARKWLGLTTKQSDKLFYPSMAGVTPAVAARMLRICLEHGNVKERYWHSARALVYYQMLRKTHVMIEQLVQRCRQDKWPTAGSEALRLDERDIESIGRELYDQLKKHRPDARFFRPESRFWQGR